MRQEEKKKYIILYHKSAGNTIKMTKPASYRSCVRSVRKFNNIGISPCEIVPSVYKKTSKTEH